MKRLCWPAFSSILLLFIAVSAAPAQVSVYGTVSASDYGYAFNGGNDVFYGDYPGFGGGLTYNFVQRAVTVGIDLRDTYTPNSVHGGNTFAASIRLGFVPPPHPCHPYFQIGPGYISARVPASSFTVGAQTISRAAVAVGVGLDVRISPSIDIRAIEIESTVGNSNAMSAATASFSSGIVYHFPHANPKNP